MALVGSFIGESTHTINSAGRISVPSKFRDVLRSKYGDEALVLVNAGNHIVAYPGPEWVKKEQEWDENPPETAQEMKLFRKMYSSAEEVSVDKQGRILIPPRLRTDCGLEDECSIVGLRNRIEIWSKPLWDAVMADDGEEMPKGAIGRQFNELIL